MTKPDTSNNSETHTCPTCDGRGREYVGGMFISVARCTTCHGSGVITDRVDEEPVV